MILGCAGEDRPGGDVRESESTCVPQRWIRPSCIVLLVAAWILDLFTPQLFVAAILLNGPIALSSLALDSRFTQLLVLLALACNASAGYVNGVHDGHWDAVALADRVIGGLSFLLVGGLSIATQRSAAQAGELAARGERTARERSVRRAIETIRSSVNPELIARSIVREARASLAVDAAHLYVFSPTIDEPTTYVSDDGPDVRAHLERPVASILSFLHRVAERREGIVAIGQGDALARLLLDTFGAPYGIAAPLVEHETTFGVLILLRAELPFEPHFDEGLSLYADQGAIALAQASLFRQLAERNDELASANVALRERGDVIRDIVYALSHDLRTPLSAARLTMQQALDGAFGPLPPAYRDILERSLSSNDELGRLAETLLLVSKYESGEASTRREAVELASVAADVVAELEPLWHSKRLRVELIAPEHPIVAGDERELRRAIVNLLANAITWTPAGRSIVLRVDRANATATVIVEDEGYGVAEPERAQLFERVRDTPSRQGAGSGLGLYLVRRIVEGHGGRITYAPRPEGGSIFTLALPLLAAAVPV